MYELHVDVVPVKVVWDEDSDTVDDIVMAAEDEELAMADHEAEERRDGGRQPVRRNDGLLWKLPGRCLAAFEPRLANHSRWWWLQAWFTRECDAAKRPADSTEQFVYDDAAAIRARNRSIQQRHHSSNPTFDDVR